MTTTTTEAAEQLTIHITTKVIALAIIIFITLLGNISLVTTITCYASLRRKRVSIFLLNIAAADLMVCLFTMTSEIGAEIFEKWIYGNIGCKLTLYVQIVTLASTTFLMTAMSIDRYQVLVQPFQSLGNSKTIWRKICAAWSLALLFALPQIFIFRETLIYDVKSTKSIPSCSSSGYTEEWQRKLYVTFLTSYILIIPTIVMSFCYISIIKVVWLRTSDGNQLNVPKIHFVTSRRTMSTLRYQAMASKRNVVKMTLSVIICFVVCWTPYFFILLVRVYSNYQIKFEEAKKFSETLGLLQSALNPFLYMIFSKKTLKNI
ncbi:hypothetical protein HELRODRAFT_77874, partial [Helobdella robusta]|uniref:G-protein coupled receptors family 1 profile domain-containing protein n=1 Tax=Helobdella robusta TaxID=6412 RepID=T1G351_HELRO